MFVKISNMVNTPKSSLKHWKIKSKISKYERGLGSSRSSEVFPPNLSHFRKEMQYLHQVFAVSEHIF